MPAGAALGACRLAFAYLRVASQCAHAKPPQTTAQQRSPHYYLASALAAHVDQGDLWKASDASIAAAVDADGGAEVLDAATRLCGLSDCTHAWGLPHVLRLASREGAHASRGRRRPAPCGLLLVDLSAWRVCRAARSARQSWACSVVGAPHPPRRQ